MSRTIRAELHYGYNLGDDDNGWQFAEVDDEDYGNTPTMPWWDEDGDELSEQAIPVLLAAAGFTEPAWEADGYSARYHEAEVALGVAFKNTGYEGAMTLLVAIGRKYSAYTSKHAEIDPAAMAVEADIAADAALANALQVLGITPKQDKPAWLLTCYYG